MSEPYPPPAAPATVRLTVSQAVGALPIPAYNRWKVSQHTYLTPSERGAES